MRCDEWSGPRRVEVCCSLWREEQKRLCRLIGAVVATPRDASKQSGQDRGRTLAAALRGILLAQSPYMFKAAVAADSAPDGALGGQGL